MLREVGVNVDCLPLLDVRQPGASDIIGDRALGAEPMQVAALGRAVLDGLKGAARSASSSNAGPRPRHRRQPQGAPMVDAPAGPRATSSRSAPSPGRRWG